jgi:hypothetical protein
MDHLSVLKSFLNNRDNLSDYIKTLETLFFNYVKTDDYISLPIEKRGDIVHCTMELKNLIENLLQANSQEKPEI